MAHPRQRTWTLAALDQGQEYRLFFDPAAHRWEVAPLEGGAPLRTRTVRAGAPQRSEARPTVTAAPAAEHRTDTGPADQ